MTIFAKYCVFCLCLFVFLIGKGEKEKEEREDSERGLRPLAGGVRQPQAAAPARACRVR